jgi:hypothetical protein
MTQVTDRLQHKQETAMCLPTNGSASEPNPDEGEFTTEVNEQINRQFFGHPPLQPRGIGRTLRQCDLVRREMRDVEWDLVPEPNRWPLSGWRSERFPGTPSEDDFRVWIDELIAESDGVLVTLAERWEPERALSPLFWAAVHDLLLFARTYRGEWLALSWTASQEEPVINRPVDAVRFLRHARKAIFHPSELAQSEHQSSFSFCITPAKPSARLLASTDLATALGVPERANAVDVALRRFAEKNPACRDEVTTPRRGEPRYLYRVDQVWPFLLDRLPGWRGSSATAD